MYAIVLFPRDCAKPPVVVICNHGAQNVLIESFTLQIRYLQNIDVNLRRKILTIYRLTFIGVRDEKIGMVGWRGGAKYGVSGPNIFESSSKDIWKRTVFLPFFNNYIELKNNY
jgi:hypothetical protein